MATREAQVEGIFHVEDIESAYVIKQGPAKSV